MPALPNVPQVIRVRMLWTIGSKEGQGVRFFYNYTGSAPTVTNLQSFGTTLNTAADAQWANVLGVENTYTGCILEDLTTPTSAVADVADSHAGSLSGDPVPAGAAFVTSYEIPTRYRGGHPRSYWPFGSGSEMTNNDIWSSTFTSTAQAAVATIIDSLVGAIEGSTTIENHVAVSYYSGFTVVTNPITHRSRNVPTLRATPIVTAVGSIVGRNYIGSFRKRRPKTS